MHYYKLPLLFAPQAEGGYTVTCPLVPELFTEGDTLEEAHANVPDAVAAVIEIYEDAGRQLLPERRGKDLKVGTLRGAVKQLDIEWDEFERA